MNDLMLKMKTVASMENDMERWLQDRDRVSKQLEGCQKKREEASRMNRVCRLIAHSFIACISSFLQPNKLLAKLYSSTENIANCLKYFSSYSPHTHFPFNAFDLAFYARRSIW